MEKLIDNFTGKFLTFSSATLFILFATQGFNWYKSYDPTPGNITTIVNLIGTVSFLSWTYAVGHKANKILKSQDINLSIFKFFNLAFLTVIGSFLIMLLFSIDNVTYGDNSGQLTYHISYSRPVEITVVFFSAVLFIIVIAAKTLVSAEKSKDAELKEYFKTLLMFAFSWIGIWFLQPRVKKL